MDLFQKVVRRGGGYIFFKLGQVCTGDIRCNILGNKVRGRFTPLLPHNNTFILRMYKVFNQCLINL